MSTSAACTPSSLPAFVENGPESIANPLVDPVPCPAVGRTELEVVVPAAKRGVQARDDVHQRVTVVPFGLLSERRFELALTGRTRIAVLVVEDIPEELKAGSFHQVRESGLLRMKLQSPPFDQLSELVQRRFGLFPRAAEHHHVVRVAHEPVA